MPPRAVKRKCARQKSTVNRAKSVSPETIGLGLEILGRLVIQMNSDLDDITGRLQTLEGRLTKLSLRERIKRLPKIVED